MADCVITLAQQMHDRTIAARQKKDEETRLALQQAKEAAGPHPIYQKDVLDSVMEYIENIMWDAASEGSDEIRLPYLDIPLLAERHAFMEANVPILAKKELRDTVEYIKQKFREKHPDFVDKSHADRATFWVSGDAFKITW